METETFPCPRCGADSPRIGDSDSGRLVHWLCPSHGEVFVTDEEADDDCPACADLAAACADCLSAWPIWRDRIETDKPTSDPKGT